MPLSIPKWGKIPVWFILFLSSNDSTLATKMFQMGWKNYSRGKHFWKCRCRISSKEAIAKELENQVKLITKMIQSTYNIFHSSTWIFACKQNIWYQHKHDLFPVLKKIQIFFSKSFLFIAFKVSFIKYNKKSRNLSGDRIARIDVTRNRENWFRRIMLAQFSIRGNH